MTDGDNNPTTIQRNGTGDITIIAPFGQQPTILTPDVNGYLHRITNPADESVELTYYTGAKDGLLETLKDARGTIYKFTYDDDPLAAA